jgi:hypothetical protein
MHWSEIPFRPPVSTLRWFAVTWLLLLCGLAGVALGRGSVGLALALAGLALAFGPVGIAYPPAVRPLYVGLMVLTFPLNWVFSRLLLALVFYCIFTPLGLLFTIIGRDVLARRFRPEQASYWADKPSGDGIRSYFRQS